VLVSPPRRHNPTSGRYNVKLLSGEILALKRENLIPIGSARASPAAAPAAAPPAARSEAEEEAEKARRKKASIGQRMATKGVAWAAKGQGGGLAGMYASEEKRREVEARPITEEYDFAAEAEKERLKGLSPQQRENDRKARMLKDMASDHLRGMDLGRAISYLDDAIKLTPEMKELWSNRSHAWEIMHEHEKALADAEKTIELAPEWPKGYLRCARALMSLERGMEAMERLRTALEMAPRDELLAEAYASRSRFTYDLGEFYL
jgi:tetratricopeptide (TPR) repeat protein